MTSDKSIALMAAIGPVIKEFVEVSIAKARLGPAEAKPRRTKKVTKVTKHDPAGRILEFETTEEEVP